MPMTTAVVHDVFASAQRSFKFGSALKIVGALVQDRPSAIYGRLDEQVDMIPVSVRVWNPKTDLNRTFRSEVIRHETLTYGLIDSVATSAADQAEQFMGSATVGMRLSFKVKGHAPVTMGDTDQPWYGTMPWGATNPIGAVLRNPWEKNVAIEWVKLDLQVRAGEVHALVGENGAGKSTLLNAYHRRPTSRCYNSHIPPELEAVERLAKALPSAASVAKLRAKGFTTALVHHPPGNRYGAAIRQKLDKAASKSSGRMDIRLIHRTARLSAYSLGQ